MTFGHFQMGVEDLAVTCATLGSLGHTNHGARADLTHNMGR